MALMFQDLLFSLYVVLVWVCVYVATRFVAPRWTGYYARHLREPEAVTVNSALQSSATVCGFCTILLLLVLSPPFLAFFGTPDWTDFTVAFGGAAVVQILTFSRANLVKTRQEVPTASEHES